MKRLLILLVCAASCTAANLGSWSIDDYLPIPATTRSVTTHDPCDASSITYRIYEDVNDVELVSDTAMTKFDSEEGFYLNREQLTAAKGFEQGKCYTVLIKATVDGVSGKTTHTFQITDPFDPNTTPVQVSSTGIAAIAASTFDPNTTPVQVSTTAVAAIDAGITIDGNDIVIDANSLSIDYNDIAVAVREEMDANSVMLSAIKAMTDLMSINTTTINTVTDANEFTITAGRDANDAYWLHAIMVQDATDSHAEVRWIDEYVTSRSVLVDEPFSFTPAPGDKVWILGPVYGGFLAEVVSGLNTSKAPIYYYKAGSSGSGPAGTTYLNESGEDP